MRKQNGGVGISIAAAVPIAAPTPGAGGMGGSAGVLIGGTISDIVAWGLHGRYSADTDPPTATIIPRGGIMGRDAGVLTGSITTDPGARVG